MENSVDLVSMTVGILTWIPCKFYCGYYEYPENSAVGILTTLPFLRCGYFDRGYFEWYPLVTYAIFILESNTDTKLEKIC